MYIQRYNTYQNHHGENPIEVLERQKLCSAWIASDKKIRELFNQLPSLECMNKNFKDEHLRIMKNCAYDFTLKYIDILYQSSTGVLGGRKSLLRIHQDNMDERKKLLFGYISTKFG